MKTARDIMIEKTRPVISIAAHRPIAEGIKRMVANKIGAILVRENDAYVGILTERDLMRQYIDTQVDFNHAPIGDYMTSPLITAPDDTPMIKLQEMFLGLYIRHILITKGNQQIGVLSIGDVTRATLLEKDAQIKELNSLASWEFYENWKWQPKKK